MTWKSSNASIASVDANGKVIAKKAGAATITVTTTDGTRLYAVSTITVRNVKNGLILDSDGQWRLYSNDVVRTSFTGLYPYGTSLFYLNKGVLDRSFNDVEYYQGDPYLVKNGQVTFNVTGLGKYKDTWWYINNSKVDTSYTGTYKWKGVTYNIKNGKVISPKPNFD